MDFGYTAEEKLKNRRGLEKIAKRRDKRVLKLEGEPFKKVVRLAGTSEAVSPHLPPDTSARAF
jgi:hypothetical protein